MFQLFHALAERVKALFVTNAALDFEAEFLTRDAERKAELLRQADRYEEEGLRGIAQDVRRQAEAISLNQPLALVLPSVQHLGAGTAPALTHANGDTTAKSVPKQLPALTKKGK